MNNLDFILVVSGPEVSANTSGTLEIVGVGFTFVMVVLALLAMVTSAIGAIFIRFEAIAAAKAAKAATAATALALTSEHEALDHEEDPALMAVIAAAVHSVVGDRAHRIVSIRPGGSGAAGGAQKS
ncbi:MAG: Na+-transporting methylmalonyl-CoA/oxaloacetate decarboxylase gamma subunit [Bacteroidia bacterium]|jgi:Na+-transporting methylmalonyl-CoA/oxaloacetate decarboxylase gamma subunit